MLPRRRWGIHEVVSALRWASALLALSNALLLEAWLGPPVTGRWPAGGKLVALVIAVAASTLVPLAIVFGVRRLREARALRWVAFFAWNLATFAFVVWAIPVRPWTLLVRQGLWIARSSSSAATATGSKAKWIRDGVNRANEHRLLPRDSPILAAAQGDSLVALDPATGATLWSHGLPPLENRQPFQVTRGFQHVFAGDLLVVTVEASTFALDWKTGRPVWTLGESCTDLRAGGRLLVGYCGQPITLAAIDSQQGRVVWRLSAVDAPRRLSTDGTRVLLSGKFEDAQQSEMRAFVPPSTEPVWRSPNISTEAAVAGEVLIVWQPVRGLRALDGTVLWSFASDRALRGAAVVGNRVFLHDDDGVVALDPMNGRLLNSWKVQTGGVLAARENGIVFAAGERPIGIIEGDSLRTLEPEGMREERVGVVGGWLITTEQRRLIRAYPLE